MEHNIQRMSAWLDDAGKVIVELVWSEGGDPLQRTRLRLPLRQAAELTEKLRSACAGNV